LDIEPVHDLLDAGQNLTGKFQLAESQCPSASRCAEPAKEKTQQLPQGVDAKAAGHYRIAFEMAGKEPEVRFDLQLGADDAFAMGAAGFGDLGDAVEH